MAFTKEQRIINSVSGNTKQQRNGKKEVKPTGSFKIPNKSGDHMRSIKRDTPVNDYDLVNKKYVDDSAISPAGSDTNIQYNDGGSFGGDGNLVWNKTTHLLTIAGGVLSGIICQGISDGATGSTPSEMNTAYAHSNDHTQAHSDYLLNSGDDTTAGAITSDGFYTGKDIRITTYTGQIELGVSQEQKIGWDGAICNFDGDYKDYALRSSVGSEWFRIRGLYGSDEIRIGIDDDVGNQINITNMNNIGRDHDHPVQTNPTVYIHSDTDPNSNNTQWISLTHNKTDGIIDVGTGKTKITDPQCSGDYYSNDGTQGWTGTFTNGDGDTVTVKNGIITDVS